MTESGDSTTRLKPGSPPPLPGKPRRRWLRCAAWTCCGLLALIVLLAIVALILALTVFKPRDPKTSLVSATVDGISPRITLPAVRVELNVTLDLDLLVNNANHVSFSHGAGKTVLSYRGNPVGDADVLPGRIPSRASTHVYSRLTVEADRLAADLGSLVADVIAGRVGFDSSTRLPGRVVFLGFIKRHAVAVSNCHFEIGFPDLAVVEQQCSQKTKL